MALDKGKAKDSLFGNIKKPKEQLSLDKSKLDTIAHQKIEEPIQELKKKQRIEENQPSAKWQQFDKVTALLTTQQKEGLDRVAKKLMKYRSKEARGIEDKERITANTIIRALIENFLKLEDSLQSEVLLSEDEVIVWVKDVFKA